jgi:hypothetical protein
MFFRKSGIGTWKYIPSAHSLLFAFFSHINVHTLSLFVRGSGGNDDFRLTWIYGRPVIASVVWSGVPALNISFSQTGNPLKKIAMVSKTDAVTVIEGHARFYFEIGCFAI